MQQKSAWRRKAAFVAPYAAWKTTVNATMRKERSASLSACPKRGARPTIAPWNTRMMDKRNRRAVVVRNAEEAIAVCRAAAAHRHSVLAISPPGAASFAGPIWFKALTAAARKATGARREILFALDCADA